MKEYFGKYRGKVQNNVDPENLGRIQVRVPSVLGLGFLSWAMPCVPYAGKGVGFHMIPQIDANVWVEFEGGNPDYPIWSGCFWGKGELTPLAPTPTMKVIKTETVNFSINDITGSFILQALPSAISIVGDISGITINASQTSIKVGPQLMQLMNGAQSINLSAASVSINNGVLEII